MAFLLIKYSFSVCQRSNYSLIQQDEKAKNEHRFPKGNAFVVNLKFLLVNSFFLFSYTASNHLHCTKTIFFSLPMLFLDWANYHKA